MDGTELHRTDRMGLRVDDRSSTDAGEKCLALACPFRPCALTDLALVRLVPPTSAETSFIGFLPRQSSLSLPAGLSRDSARPATRLE